MRTDHDHRRERGPAPRAELQPRCRQWARPPAVVSAGGGQDPPARASPFYRLPGATDRTPPGRAKAVHRLDHRAARVWQDRASRGLGGAGDARRGVADARRIRQRAQRLLHLPGCGHRPDRADRSQHRHRARGIRDAHPRGSRATPRVRVAPVAPPGRAHPRRRPSPRGQDVPRCLGGAPRAPPSQLPGRHGLADEPGPASRPAPGHAKAARDRTAGLGVRCRGDGVPRRANRAPAEPGPGAGARRADGGVGGGDLPRSARAGAARVPRRRNRRGVRSRRLHRRVPAIRAGAGPRRQRRQAARRGRRSSTSSSHSLRKPSRAWRTRRSGSGSSHARTCSSARPPEPRRPTTTTTCCATTSRRAQRREPGAGPELHRRAAAWYSDAGRPELAIEHAIASGDADAAARSWSRRRRCGRSSSVTATCSPGGSARSTTRRSSAGRRWRSGRHWSTR